MQQGSDFLSASQSSGAPANVQAVVTNLQNLVVAINALNTTLMKIAGSATIDSLTTSIDSVTAAVNNLTTQLTTP